MFSSSKTILSSDTNVIKFVFEGDNIVAETVLYKYPTFEERTVICCSTQSGCPIGCTFCGTGKFFTRNLTADEIVFQIKTALDYTKQDPGSIKKFQIMFMSMGEPLLNYAQLQESIERLAMDYPNAQLLVSTSLPPGTEDLFMLQRGAFVHVAKLIPNIGIQFSVHESTDTARARLIPTNINSLTTISRAGHRWYNATKRKPYLNYCVHEGNNRDLDVELLAGRFVPDIWEVTLSVICEKDQSMKNAIEDKLTLVTDFASKITAAGYSVRVFNPAGQDDIGGGCGQLWYVQEWARNYKNKQR